MGLDNPVLIFLDFMVSVGLFALFRWAKGLREQ